MSVTCCKGQEGGWPVGLCAILTLANAAPTVDAILVFCLFAFNFVAGGLSDKICETHM